MTGAETEMQVRSTDLMTSVKLTREIPVVWLATSVAAVVLWALSQWVQYSKLQDSSIAQSKSIAEFSIKLAEISSKMDDAKMKNMEQDFILGDVKHRLEALESFQNSRRNERK